MNARALSLVAASAVLIAALPVAVAQQKKPTRSTASIAATKSTFQKDVVNFTSKFCVACHTGPNGADGINIPKGVKEADVKGKYAKLYRKLANYAGNKQMPPASAKPQPADADRKAFTNWIKNNVK